MRIINRKNIGPIIGISYTLVSLFIVLSEMVLDGVSSTHLNILMGLAFTLIGISILSFHYLLDRFSPLVMVIMQYIIGVVLVVGITSFLGVFESLHSDAYKDMIRSYSVVYFIGAIVYYLNLIREIKKQNNVIEFIRSSDEV